MLCAQLHNLQCDGEKEHKDVQWIESEGASNEELPELTFRAKPLAVGMGHDEATQDKEKAHQIMRVSEECPFAEALWNVDVIDRHAQCADTPEPVQRLKSFHRELPVEYMPNAFSPNFGLGRSCFTFPNCGPRPFHCVQTTADKVGNAAAPCHGGLLDKVPREYGCQ